MDDSEQSNEKNPLGFSIVHGLSEDTWKEHLLSQVLYLSVWTMNTSKQELFPSQAQKNHLISEQKAESLSVQFFGHIFPHKNLLLCSASFSVS